MKKNIKKAIIILFAIGVLGNLLGENKSEQFDYNVSESKVREGKVKEEPIEENIVEIIEYLPISADELIKDVENNAFGAKQNHQNQYYEITGVIRNIDNNGEYISIEPQDNKFRLLTIMCYVPKDMRPTLVNYQIGVEVRVRGKVTDVGEVMGYSVAVDELN